MNAAADLHLHPVKMMADGEKRMLAEIKIDGIEIGSYAWQKPDRPREITFYLRARRSSTQISATTEQLRDLGRMLIAQADRIDAELAETEGKAA